MTEVDMKTLAKETADRFWNGRERLESYIEEALRMATAKQQARNQKADSPRIGRWLKWAKERFLPARATR